MKIWSSVIYVMFALIKIIFACSSENTIDEVKLDAIVIPVNQINLSSSSSACKDSLSTNITQQLIQDCKINSQGKILWAQTWKLFFLF